MDGQATSSGGSLQNTSRGGATCPHCGSGEIATGVSLTQIAQVHLNIGLAYKAAAIFTGAETLHADLCRACGTVLRFFVMDPKRNWIQQ